MVLLHVFFHVRVFQTKGNFMETHNRTPNAKWEVVILKGSVCEK